MLNKNVKELLKEARDNFEKEHTPLPGNKCHCGGNIFKDVTGFAFGKFLYSLPKCAKCGRLYLNAHSVSTRGENEFLENLSVPMTI